MPLNFNYLPGRSVRKPEPVILNDHIVRNYCIITNNCQLKIRSWRHNNNSNTFKDISIRFSVLESHEHFIKVIKLLRKEFLPGICFKACQNFETNFQGDPVYVEVRIFNDQKSIKKCLYKRILPLFKQHLKSPIFWPDLPSINYSSQNKRICGLKEISKGLTIPYFGINPKEKHKHRLL